MYFEVCIDGVHLSQVYLENYVRGSVTQTEQACRRTVLASDDPYDGGHFYRVGRGEANV